MNSLYQSNIQPFQGCDIQVIIDRGFTPTVIQIVPLRGTIYIEIKRISSILFILIDAGLNKKRYTRNTKRKTRNTQYLNYQQIITKLRTLVIKHYLLRH